MSALLIDTNALLLLLGGDDRLGTDARRKIETSQLLIVSEVTLWEIAIKVSIGTLQAIPGLSRAVRELGFERTGITDAYLDRVASLPFHHRDPFDRMLIAQALCDDLEVLTSDSVFANYGVRVVDARA